MTGVPSLVRVLGGLAGVFSVLLVLSLAAGAALTANSVTASGVSQRSFSVGSKPTVEVTTSVGEVEARSGPGGRVDVEERWSASSLTRATAAAALREVKGDLRQQGDVVRVTLGRLNVTPWTFNRSSSVRVTVPEGTTLRVVADTAEVRLVNLSGTAQVFDRGGRIAVDSSRLTGDSQFHNRFGQLQLTSVSIAGHTTLDSDFGRIDFNGSLAPGGSTLDVREGAGEVELLLPQPTDARARISVESGAFDADPAWGFQVVSAAGSRTATADLGSNPSGSVFVSVGAGHVSVGRQ